MLALESLVMLAAARVLVKTSPQKGLVRRMGAVTPDATRFDFAESSPRQQGAGSRACKMVERAARITWWRSLCLEKAGW